MSDSQVSHRLQAAADVLGRIADREQHGYVCWVSGGNSDEGIDRCFSCAKDEADRLRKKHPETEFFVDRAYGAYEAERTCYCENCSAPLEYTLLRYGVIEEVQHFLSYPLTQDEGPLVAYEVHAILRGARWLDPKEDGELIEDALRVGESAVQLIGFRDELARMADDGCPNKCLNCLAQAKG